MHRLLSVAGCDAATVGNACWLRYGPATLTEHARVSDLSAAARELHRHRRPRPVGAARRGRDRRRHRSVRPDGGRPRLGFRPPRGAREREGRRRASLRTRGATLVSCCRISATSTSSRRGTTAGSRRSSRTTSTDRRRALAPPASRRRVDRAHPRRAGGVLRRQHRADRDRRRPDRASVEEVPDDTGAPSRGARRGGPDRVGDRRAAGRAARLDRRSRSTRSRSPRSCARVPARTSGCSARARRSRCCPPARSRAAPCGRPPIARSTCDRDPSATRGKRGSIRYARPGAGRSTAARLGPGAIGGVLIAQAIVERRVPGGCRVLLDVPSQVAANVRKQHLVHEPDGRRRALDVEEDGADRRVHTSAETVRRSETERLKPASTPLSV